MSSRSKYLALLVLRTHTTLTNANTHSQMHPGLAAAASEEVARHALSHVLAMSTTPTSTTNADVGGVGVGVRAAYAGAGADAGAGGEQWASSAVTLLLQAATLRLLAVCASFGFGLGGGGGGDRWSSSSSSNGRSSSEGGGGDRRGAGDNSWGGGGGSGGDDDESHDAGLYGAFAALTSRWREHRSPGASAFTAVVNDGTACSTGAVVTLAPVMMMLLLMTIALPLHAHW